MLLLLLPTSLFLLLLLLLLMLLLLLLLDKVGTFDHSAIRTSWWLQTPVLTSIGLTKHDLRMNHLNTFSVFSWKPYANSSLIMKDSSNGHPHPRPTNVVYIYHMHYYYHDGEISEIHLARRFLPYLIKHIHTSGMVIFSNIGIHLTNERNAYKGIKLPQKEPMILIEKMNAMLTWLHDLTLLNPFVVTVYRESTPSHFNSPIGDGAYENYITSINANYDYNKPNSWDQSKYHCREIFNLSVPSLSQTPENYIAHKLLTAWKSTKHQPRVQILRIFDYLASYDKMKHGNCGAYQRIATIDCVHYCANHPAMWAPIWKDILDILHNSRRSNVAMESSESRETASPLTTTRASPAKSKSEEEVPGWLASHPWANAKLVVVPGANNNNKYYLQRGGLLHGISPEVYQQIFNISIDGGSSNDNNNNNNQAEILNQEQISALIESFPAEFIPDNSLICFVHNTFLMEHGKLRMLPDLDTVDAYKQKLGHVGCRHVNAELFDVLPQGADIGHPLPNGTLVYCEGCFYLYTDDTLRWVPDVDSLNSIYSLKLVSTAATDINGEQLFTYTKGPDYQLQDGSLLVYEKAYYVYTNGTVQWVPDMDTFHAMKLNSKVKIGIPPSKFALFTLGPPLQKLNH